MKHILTSQQFDRPQLDELLSFTDHLRNQFEDESGKRGLRKSLADKLMYAIFYQPSTRTRFSFCTAAFNLGMTPIWTENAGEFSSAIKGETLEDTIHVLCQYDPSVIVLRHDENGAAERAAAIVDSFHYKPAIINAGDGTNEHPTQALLDLYTIRRELGTLTDLNILIGGDLANGRTARSLVYLMSKYSDNQFTFFSAPNLKMGKDILSHLEKRDIPYTEVTERNCFPDILRSADVIYWTRLQSEAGSVDTEPKISIGLPEMRIMKPSTRLLHPLPRVGEINPEADEDPRVACFRQVKNGLLIRMALLEIICK